MITYSVIIDKSQLSVLIYNNQLLAHVCKIYRSNIFAYTLRTHHVNK